MSSTKTPKIIICAIATLQLFFISVSYAGAGDFEVVRVYDGDTLKAVGHDIEIKVRLVGIDAPETSKKKYELGQPYSQQAKKFLISMVMNKIIDVRCYGTDRYNRMIDIVYAGDVNVNLEIVKTGLAEVYRGKPPRGFDHIQYWLTAKEAKDASYNYIFRSTSDYKIYIGRFS